MTEYSDTDLLTMFRDNSLRHQAFSQIVSKYQKKVYYFARRMVISHEDADDVVQNVFIKVWNNLDGFREDSRFFTWLYRIVVNESISVLKSNRLRSFMALTSPESQALKAVHDDNFFTGDQVQLRLREAIAVLPKKQQLVFNMRYYDELSYEQISEILGTSVGALKASYHFATKKIEAYVTGS